MVAAPAGHWDDLDAAAFEDLARTYGTPFYLYDADAVRRRIDRVRAAFDGLARVYFAVKANPNLELLRSIRDVADGLDISSEGELAQAALAGFDMDRISFAGPAKTEADLLPSVRKGVGAISVESPRELLEVARIAGGAGRRANVVIRVNPRQTIKEYGMKMGGRPVQFGIDEEELAAVAPVLREHADVLNFRGLHAYTGSQCFETAGIEKHVTDTLRIVREFESATGLDCAAVNLGGGFGVSHGEADRELDVEALGRALVPRLREFLAGSEGARGLIFELGRYLVAEAGLYVTRVVGSKDSRGKTFFVVDGGLHHHLAAAGMFGVGLRTNYALRNLSRPAAPALRCNIAGPLCNPTDLLGLNVELPAPQPGDLVGVLKSGSYSLTASPLLFLGRPTPAELVRRGNEIALGRRAHGIADFN